MAKDQGIIHGLFAPQLQSAIMRLSAGEKLDKMHITSKDSVPAISLDGKIYTILANKSRGEIVVFIGDIVAIQTEAALEGLASSVTQTIKKMTAAGVPNLKFLKAEMISCIKSAYSAPERIGVDLPFSVLAAIPDTAVAVKKLPAEGVSASPSAPAPKPAEIKKYIHQLI